MAGERVVESDQRMGGGGRKAAGNGWERLSLLPRGRSSPSDG